MTVDGLADNDGTEARRHGTMGNTACAMNLETNVSGENIYVSVLFIEANTAEPSQV